MDESLSSRAALLLQRELYRLQKADSPEGVQAEPVGNDIFHWQAVLHGVPETPWEGGIFRLELRFDEDYNERPPEVQFLTVPFHPNVDMHTGTPCIPLLQDPMEWDPDMSLCDLLSSLRTLLASPSLSHPANLAAAEIYTASPRLYGQLVRDCVVASRRVDSGLTAFDPDDPALTDRTPSLEPYLPIPAEPDTPTRPPAAVQTVSFDEYHAGWRMIATSVPKTRSGEKGQDLHLLPPTASALTPAESKDLMARQRELVFGRFPPRKPKAAVKPVVKDGRVEAMRQLYLRSAAAPAGGGDAKGAVVPTAGTGAGDVGTRGVVGGGEVENSHGRAAHEHSEEDWEDEAESLLNWTARLDHRAMVVS